MTNMLPRDRAELIMAEYAAGKPVRVIAEAYGHSITTVRDYARGRRAPGEPAARADDFAPFAGYCRQRLADDPHLRRPALLAELSGLGSPAPQGHVLPRTGAPRHPDAPVSRLPPREHQRILAAGRQPGAPAVPAASASLPGGRGNPGIVPRPPRRRQPHHPRCPARHPPALVPHQDPLARRPLAARAAHARADDAAASGSPWSAAQPPHGIKNALPAFGETRGQPARAVTACRLCTAARRIRQPVPVHLPACHQVCLRHGIWLSGPGTPQFSVRELPRHPGRRRRARRLLRRCTTEQLIYARIQAAQQPGSPRPPRAWKQRMHALITSNPRPVIESCPQELFTAAGYPETVATAAATITQQGTGGVSSRGPGIPTAGNTAPRLSNLH